MKYTNKRVLPFHKNDMKKGMIVRCKKKREEKGIKESGVFWN